MKVAEDFPTDPAAIESDAELLFDDDEKQIDAIIVLSQLNPLEQDVDGDARWSPDQHKLILAAVEVVESWER